MVAESTATTLPVSQAWPVAREYLASVEDLAANSTARFRFHNAKELMGLSAAILDGEIKRLDGDLDGAIARVREVLDFKGRGHSCGIHTRDADSARRVAEELDVVRVLVNMAHTFGNGGGFDSGLNFTLSMGCGTWQGNSISENLSYKHFINITHLCRVIPEDRPEEQELFGGYWEKYGQ